MSNENWLIYPTVDLFVYDLADGIGQNEDKISQNRELFLQKIYGDNISATDLEQLKQAETETAEYIELLGDKKVAKFEDPLDGYAYPVKIGDTYAAQFDLSGKIEPDADKRFAPKKIDCLKSLKQQVISRVNPAATIGQSWLVWGQLTADDQDALTIAKDCYTKLELFPNAKWDRDLKAEGKFLDANFYELWLPPGDRGKIEQNYHVLICLFPYNNGQAISDISKTVAKLYVHLMRLFAFRNKVIWAYTQSRQLKTDLKDAARTIQQIVTQLPQQVNAPKVDLKELQQSLVDALTIFSVYANYISRLEEQENTIKTNLKNYKRRLETIGKDMGNNAEAFKFLSSFSDFAKQKYVWQVAADNRSLTAGLRLLENAIQTIEGIIEIERAKSDRTLNVTIGAVGVGIATSGVYASVYAGQINSPASPTNPMDVNVVFGWSIGLGILAGALSAIVLIAIGNRRR
jgi:acetolactate synthase small subunit